MRRFWRALTLSMMCFATGCLLLGFTVMGLMLTTSAANAMQSRFNEDIGAMTMFLGLLAMASVFVGVLTALLGE